eukprot:TRINITY_DN3445_c0_g1_i1.p2 TRINITY_DN3445_c0_g1~~TRINITY_DN3445_c0_g1_i1.p2  ORF type:complete len:115 (+),score=6.25 TRINITY_DN3445_c0_g1_i1:244-588(+)
MLIGYSLLLLLLLALFSWFHWVGLCSSFSFSLFPITTEKINKKKKSTQDTKKKKSKMILSTFFFSFFSVQTPSEVPPLPISLLLRPISPPSLFYLFLLLRLANDQLMAISFLFY